MADLPHGLKALVDVAIVLLDTLHRQSSSGRWGAIVEVAESTAIYELAASEVVGDGGELFEGEGRGGRIREIERCSCLQLFHSLIIPILSRTYKE